MNINIYVSKENEKELEEMKTEAYKKNRGIGYIIFEAWKKWKGERP
ncbi:MAG: hypothetical protein GY853_15370 [PVC group bacterium]|nr:hypothetical protein [PVC group bacterium]